MPGTQETAIEGVDGVEQQFEDMDLLLSNHEETSDDDGEEEYGEETLEDDGREKENEEDEGTSGAGLAAPVNWELQRLTGFNNDRLQEEVVGGNITDNKGRYRLSRVPVSDK